MAAIDPNVNLAYTYSTSLSEVGKGVSEKVWGLNWWTNTILSENIFDIKIFTEYISKLV